MKNKGRQCEREIQKEKNMRERLMEIQGLTKVRDKWRRTVERKYLPF
jgi:hypothetical protein